MSEDETATTQYTTTATNQCVQCKSHWQGHVTWTYVNCRGVTFGPYCEDCKANGMRFGWQTGGDDE